MPGISLQFCKIQDRRELSKKEFQTLLSNPDYEIVCRADSGYPLHKLETSEFFAFIEGKIYSENIEGVSFEKALTKLWKGEQNAEDYFWELDGEFIVILASKRTDKVIFINDALGRLPVYFHEAKPLIISRDLFSIKEMLGNLEFDQSGIYQFLRLGFPLGNRTLFKRIKKVRYKTILHFKSNDVRKTSGVHLNIHGSKALDENDVETLYEEFLLGIKLRTKKNKIALSLSGGLDSRAILGSLAKENLPYSLFTFHYSNPIIDRDFQISQELARHYKGTLSKINVDEWSPQHFKTLIRDKMGMNYLGMAFILEFLKFTGKNDLMLTGDGGDKTLAPLTPLLAPGLNGLAPYILQENQISSKLELENLLELDISKEEKTITDYILKLPGSNSKEKYKSFLLFERGMNWLFEGEDRNRSIIWSTSPFYSPRFFQASHRIRESDKANYLLFAKFLERIDPELNRISNANWNFALSEKSKVRQLFLKQKIKQGVKKFYRSKPRGVDTEDSIHQALRAELSGGNLDGKLPIKKLDQNRLTIGLGWHLLTLAYLINEIDDK